MNIKIFKLKYIYLLLIFFSHFSDQLYSKNKVSFKGHWTQGGMIIGKTISKSKVFFNDQEILKTKKNFFVLGFGRDAQLEGTIRIEYKNGKQFITNYKLAKRSYQIQHINGLPKSKVSIPEKSLIRINKESKMIQKTRKQFLKKNYFTLPFIWPTKGKITGVYGSQRILNGKPRSPHYGVDIAATNGTPVVAPNSGNVVFIHTNMYFNGGTIIIDHGYGIHSSLIHLSKILVKKGSIVKKKQIIGLVGSTGRSTGPHLDWRIYWFLIPLDPLLLFSEKNNYLPLN